MSPESTDTPDTLVGRPADEVVEALVASTDADATTVRSALDPFVTDGVVTRDAIDETLSDTSKVVSTAETRTELAGIDMTEARESAASAPDLPTIESRFEGFERRLADVEARVEDLTPRLQELVSLYREESLYDLATGLRTLASRAQTLQGEADELGVDLQEFNRWLNSPVARREELDADVEAVETTIEAIADALDGLAERDRAGAVWADATLRHRLADLLVADVRAELMDLRAWGADLPEDDTETPTLDALAERLDTAASRLDRLEDRLEQAARPAWLDEYGEAVAGFETELEGVEPPIPWGVVQDTLERYRERTLEER
jgi:archaellum component FlaC